MGEINGLTLDGSAPPSRVPAVEEVTPPADTPAPPAASPAAHPNTTEEIGRAWRESGEHWEKLTLWLANRREVARRRQSQRANEGRTITLNGYGASLFVKNGALVVQTGRSYSTQEPVTETLTRGVHGVTQLVWITNGGAGSLSLDALKWCARQSITVTLLTERGECLAVIHPTADAPPSLDVPGRGEHYGGARSRPDVALRRAQYALQPSGRDVDVARRLIERKIAAQQATAEKHTELPDRKRALEATSLALDWLRLEPPTPFLRRMEGVRVMEAKASRGYFKGWLGLPLRVDARVRARFPAPWLVVAERASPLTRWHGPKRATNPAQAMLNFAYGCLESQVRAALNVIGADMACGVMHADATDRYRDSLVYDAMEPLRGPVDDLFLTMLQEHVFTTGDFQARTDGSVAIHPSLCRVLVELCRLPQRRVDDEARWLRALILDEAHS